MATTHPRTRLDPDERRAQILSAAVRVFRSNDYSAVSLDTLADAAGVTRGLLHHYFGSKRALYLAALERTLRLPASAQLVPDGATGPIEEVLAQCVDRWLDVVEAGGGLWSGAAGSSAIGDSEVDQLFIGARDELVERMIEELPFSPELDPGLLRGALRSYSAFARVAIDEWLGRGTLDRHDAHTMLTDTLIAIVVQVVPAMSVRSDDPPR